MTTTQELRIPVDDDVGDVSALLHRPTGAKALYVFAHGAGAGMRHAFMEAAAEGLAARGVATLRYQFPYMEAGRKAPNPPRILLATVRAAVAFAVDVSGGLPLLAGGKSMGGRMTSTAASQAPLPEVRGLVFFGFPLHAAGKPSAGRGDHLAGVGLPMLFLQGDRDKLADLELLTPLLSTVEPAPSLHVEEGADHGFHVLKRSGRTDQEVLDALCRRVASWMEELV